MENNTANNHSHIKNKSYPVRGLSCASCAISVETILKAKEGVKEVSVNFASKKATVVYDEHIVQPIDLKKEVQSIGYDLDLPVETESEDEEEMMAHSHHHEMMAYSSLKRNTLGAFVLTLPVFIIGMFFHHSAGFGLNLISFVLTAIVLFGFGRMFFVSAYKKAKHLQTNMDTLVALSTGVAFLFSSFNLFFPQVLSQKGIAPFVYFETSAVIVTFILLGKLLEKNATDKAFSSVKKLMELQVKTATVIMEGKYIEKAIKEIVPGDLVVVKPGEKIPVDGEVREGETFIDESMISGEPVPVYKTINSKALAGTVNTNGSITLEVKKRGKDTMLGQIIKSVQKAQESKAPVQKLVDKVAGIFVPVVIVIALITLLAWIFIGGIDKLTYGIYSCITVLVIACPCALGLATPIAIMVGVGRAAKDGILIKDAQSLEVAHKVDTIVLDKTGTLTMGKPEVKKIEWNERIEDINHYKNILYTLEKKSEHPLAKAVCIKLEEDSVELVKSVEFKNVAGRGVQGIIEGKKYAIGNQSVVDANIFFTKQQLEFKSKEKGNTLVFFADEQKVIAIIVLADKLKESSKAAVEQLLSADKEVHLLTGDNEDTAKLVSQELGIKNYKSGVLPSDKLKYIETLQNKNKVVAMAGDGINDSEALAKADVGIAMASGTDIAMDVASITLTHSEPKNIFQAIKISRSTMKIVKQNLFWAFVYNIIGIPLAAGIFVPFTGLHINPMLAGAAMAFSSVSVVLNSLRLKWV